MTKEHDEKRTFVQIEHYEDHPDREESAEFTRLKREFHKDGTGCWIGNGYCQGDLEVHHNIIEWSAATSVDWEKVRKDHPNLTHVDQKEQMLVLCTRHHRGKFHGLHSMTYPIWVLQRYMTQEALEDFERAIAQEEAKK